jgi:uncharacterized protein YbjQ (UPF0145 family)
MMIQLSLFVVLLACGYFFGRLAEKKHFKSIIRRENLLSKIKLTTSKFPINRHKELERSILVCGEVAVSVDYFKSIVASIIGFFGGSIKGFETLMERARREATLRMQECIPGASEIINIRLETTSVSQGPKQHVKCVIVVASGTALFYDKD